MSASHANARRFTSYLAIYSGPDRRCPLFFSCAGPREPRISAVKAMSLADNFLQKQQKQRECRLARVDSANFAGRPRVPRDLSTTPGRSRVVTSRVGSRGL
jgi:hypothetical protein